MVGSAIFFHINAYFRSLFYYRVGQVKSVQMERASHVGTVQCLAIMSVLGQMSLSLAASIMGNNVIVGAGSVVVKDVPANCVVAGNPAKEIRRYKEPL